jgi:5S rRNA maturation endonuclease (ribonuclease M5)
MLDNDCIDIALRLGLTRKGEGNFHCFNPTEHKNGDSNPSLYIRKKRFDCYGCGKEGNCVELVKQVLGYDFHKANEWLKDNGFDHYKYKNTFTRENKSDLKTNKKDSLMNKDLLTKCFEDSSKRRSPLMEYLIKLSKQSGLDNVMNEHLKSWYCGADEAGNHTYWYFDEFTQLQTCKIIPYSKSGKRLRRADSPLYNNADALYGYETKYKTEFFSKNNNYRTGIPFGLQQFDDNFERISPRTGEVIIFNNNTPIIIVEGEKDAVLGSFILPQYIWVSGIEASRMNETLYFLIRRPVLILYDNDEAGLHKAQRLYSELSLYNKQCRYLDDNGKPAIEALFPDYIGFDIADIVIDLLNDGSIKEYFSEDVIEDMGSKTDEASSDTNNTSNIKMRG